MKTDVCPPDTPDSRQIVDQIGRVVLGKTEEIRLALTCLFASGHLLIEDLPGIGKTTLAKVLSRCLGLAFQRIQCTSDMLPGDILGVSVFNTSSGEFDFHAGPIFTQVLLADEINRAPPKTQSALLEAMEERQVTIEGKTHRLQSPFFVIATQNPTEQSGTFPLPESQKDRFLMRISLGYPGREAEKQLLHKGGVRAEVEDLQCCLSPERVEGIQDRVNAVHVSEGILDYVQELLANSRQSSMIAVGLSPRAGLSLLQAARSWALANERDYVIPEDVQHVFPWVAGHRLVSAEDGMELSADRLRAFIAQVPVP